MVLGKLASILGLLSVVALDLRRVVGRQPEAPIVDLGYAQYQGDVNTELNITQFNNIRYAAPPIGDHRFQAPRPPHHVDGVQQANAQPPECYQASMGEDFTNPFATVNFKKRQTNVTQTEDCLYLKVAAPGTSWSSAPEEGWPVVVWFHGGGYVSGSASEFNGQDLIVDAGGGVVSVIVQYRLGLFGFLPGSEVKENGALNAGLLDQAYALQWVQKNIHLFGGDPGKVTIWGQSAGAGGVMQHVIANGGNTQPPLFRAAITSSVSLHQQYWYNDTTYFSQIANGTGCSRSHNVMSCLRSADASTLEALNTEINADGFYGTYALGPVIDGSLILESPSAALMKGVHNGDWYMAINQQYEGVIFTSDALNASSTTNLTLFIHELYPFLTTEHVNEAAKLYSTYPGSIYNQSVAALGEATYICPSYLILSVFPGASWKGEFAIPPAWHGQDIPYYFDDPGSTPPYANADFQKAFSSSFLAFVKNLNPNTNGTSIAPEWPMYDSGNTEMLFNATNGTGPASQPVVKTFTTDPDMLTRCAFWRSVANETHQ